MASMINSTLSFDRLSTILDPELATRHKRYYANHHEEWLWVIHAILESGQEQITTTPLLARQVLLITPKELLQSKEVQRVHELALFALTTEEQSPYERLKLLEDSLASGNKQWILANLDRIDDPYAKVRYGGTNMPILHRLAGEGLVDVMEAWKKQHPDLDLNMATPDSGAAIHQAAGRVKIEAVRWLLDNGADIDQAHPNSYTALHMTTAMANGIALSELLVQRGANLTILDDDGHTPLHHVGQQGNRALYQKMVAAGADAAMVDHQGNVAADYLGSGQAIMNWLAVQALMRQEGELGEGSDGAPLQGNAMFGLMAGDLQAPEEGAAISAEAFGFNGAHLAVIAGENRAVAGFAMQDEIGATDKRGRTPLDLAIEMDRWEVFDQLVAVLATVDLARLTELLTRSEQTLAYFANRLKDEEFLERFASILNITEGKEEFQSVLSMEQFFDCARLFSPDEQRARLATRTQEEVWGVDQAQYMLYNGIINYLLMVDNPNAPALVEGQIAQKLQEELEGLTSYQIASAAANLTIGPGLAMAIEAFSPNIQELVIPQLSDECFLLLLSRVKQGARPAYLRLASSEQKIRWMKATEPEIREARESWHRKVRAILAGFEQKEEEGTAVAKVVGRKRPLDEADRSDGEPVAKRARSERLSSEALALVGSLRQKKTGYERLHRALLESVDPETGEVARWSEELFGAGSRELERHIADLAPFIAALSAGERVPEALIDPIMGERMEDPVRAKDGHVYERSSIERWFGSCEGDLTSPMTGEKMERGGLVAVSIEELLGNAGNEGGE